VGRALGPWPALESWREALQMQGNRWQGKVAWNRTDGLGLGLAAGALGVYLSSSSFSEFL
jgi:hypothetical protein